MLAAALLMAAAGIVAFGLRTGGGISRRIARLLPQGTRPRAIRSWAIGTAVTYGLTSVVALVLLGRLDAVGTLPVELRSAALTLGLPGGTDTDVLLTMAGSAALGGAIGIAILLLRVRRGRGAFGLRYRSPAAARSGDEMPAAALLAVSAGVSEELFFRLLIPLLVATVFDAPVAGVAFGLAAFVALHRHQGIVGMAAVALVGGALTIVYLLTGMLWVAMAIHILIDLNALILRPWLTRRW